MENLAEKVNECLINKSLSIVCIQLGLRKLSVIQSSGVIRYSMVGIEVNGRTVWTSRIVRYIVGVRC